MPPRRDRKRRRNWKRFGHNNDCRKSNASEQTSGDDILFIDLYIYMAAAQSSCIIDLEIPGFYYDKEKKRYFRILPGHCQIPGGITSEVLKKKKIEIKRKEDLQLSELSKQYRVSDIHRNILGRHPLKSASINNISSRVLLRQTLGSVLSPRLEELTYRMCAKKLSPYLQKSLEPYVESPLHILLNENQNEIWSASSEKRTLGSNLQCIRINGALVNSESNPLVSSSGTNLTITPWCSSVPHTITSLCYATPKHSDANSAILFTTVCPLGTDASRAYIKEYGYGTDSDTVSCNNFHLGVKATWTCAWNPWLQQFSVGSEKCALIVDTATRYLWQLDTKGSDVLSQIFTGENWNVLLSGTRSGKICQHDLRVSRKRCVQYVSHPSSVCSLHMMSSGQHIIASDFAGNIKRWDLRQSKVVQSYEGHVNEYKTLPVKLDSTESLLYAVGQDGYTRMWDACTSECIKTIAPPCSVSVQSLPTVVYSSNWAGQQGNVALIMAVHDRLHVYGIKETEV